MLDRLEIKYLDRVGDREITIYVTASVENGKHHFYHPITGKYTIERI